MDRANFLHRDQAAGDHLVEGWQKGLNFFFAVENQGVIANGAGRFSRDAATSVGRIDPVTDLEFFDVVDYLRKETAVTDETVVFTNNDAEL